MRILPVSTIDDTKTVLQVVMRLQKYLEENPIRNVFYIDEEYTTQQVAYDKTKVSVTTELDVHVSADDIILFKNGYVAVVDSVGSEYVVIKANEVVSVKGEKGDTGATGATGETGPAGRDGTDGTNGTDGVSITGVTKTGTSGLVDTYTITFSNGTTSTFTVTNGRDGTNGTNGTDGRGIVSITKTGTVGLVDTYTILYTDNSTSTFTVTNGESGGMPAGGSNGDFLGKAEVGNVLTPVYFKPFQLFGRNMLLNSSFRIDQIGTGTTAQTTTSTGKYCRDMWYMGEDTKVQGTTDEYKTYRLYGGSITQFITEQNFAKYVIVGVTYRRGDPAHEYAPDLKFYNADSVYANAIRTITTPISYSGSNLVQKFIICNAEIGIHAIKISFNNGGNDDRYVSIVNAFVYPLSTLNEIDNMKGGVPYVYEGESEDLERCKYYFERITQVSSIISQCRMFGSNEVCWCYFPIRPKRIIPTFVSYATNLPFVKLNIDGTITSFTLTPSLSFSYEYNHNNQSIYYFANAVIRFISSITNAISVSQDFAQAGYFDLDARYYPS